MEKMTAEEVTRKLRDLKLAADKIYLITRVIGSSDPIKQKILKKMKKHAKQLLTLTERLEK